MTLLIKRKTTQVFFLLSAIFCFVLTSSLFQAEAHNTGQYHAHNSISRLSVPSFLVHITLKKSRIPAHAGHHPGPYIRCLGVLSSFPNNTKDLSYTSLTGRLPPYVQEGGHAEYFPPYYSGESNNYQIISSDPCLLNYDHQRKSLLNLHKENNLPAIDLQFVTDGMIVGIPHHEGLFLRAIEDSHSLHSYVTYLRLTSNHANMTTPFKQKRGAFNLEHVHHKNVPFPKPANFLTTDKPPHKNIGGYVVTLDANSRSLMTSPKVHKVDVYYPEPGQEIFLKRFPELRNTWIRKPPTGAVSWNSWLGSHITDPYVPAFRFADYMVQLHDPPPTQSSQAPLGKKDRRFRNGVFLGKVVEGNPLCGGDEGAPVITDHSQGTGVPHVIGIISDIFVDDKAYQKKDGSYRCGRYFMIQSVRAQGRQVKTDGYTRNSSPKYYPFLLHDQPGVFQ